MLKHMVFWKLKEKENIEFITQKMKADLERLKETIEGIEYLEVHFAENDVLRKYDVCLLSSFESIGDYEKYEADPKHLKVVDYINTVVCETVLFNYEEGE